MGFINKIKDTLEEYKPEPFDPSVFHDALAMQTDWKPAHRGGTSSTNYSINEVSPRRVEFTAHGNIRFTSGLMMGVGAVIIAVLAMGWIDLATQQYYAGIIFGIILLSSGFSRLRRIHHTRVFDLDKGYFWVGKKQPKGNLQDLEPSCKIDDIHAIQLLHEECNRSGDSGSDFFYSYELNLVLQDGSRQPVVDHGNLSRIREEADRLATFLGVPTWDAIPSHCY